MVFAPSRRVAVILGKFAFPRRSSSHSVVRIGGEFRETAVVLPGTQAAIFGYRRLESKKTKFYWRLRNASVV